MREQTELDTGPDAEESGAGPDRGCVLPRAPVRGRDSAGASGLHLGAGPSSMSRRRRRPRPQRRLPGAHR